MLSRDLSLSNFDQHASEHELQEAKANDKFLKGLPLNRNSSELLAGWVPASCLEKVSPPRG